MELIRSTTTTHAAEARKSRGPRKSAYRYTVRIRGGDGGGVVAGPAEAWRVALHLISGRQGDQRLPLKSALNLPTSVCCHSVVVLSLPKKKRRIFGSSTNARPPTKSRFLYSHTMRSIAYLI